MEAMKFETPIALRWKISKKEVQSVLNRSRQSCSKVFGLDECYGVKYGLVLMKSEQNHVGIGLSLAMRRSTTITAKYKLTIASANYVKEQEKIFDRTSTSVQIISPIDHFLEPASNYFVDGILVVTMEGILSFEKERKHKHFKGNIKTGKSLGELLWDRDDKDFGFVSDGKTIMVHKLIISTKSPVFDRMIECGLKESKENKVAIIDFDYQVVELALKFCYGIDITDLLTICKSFKLLQFSDKYDIEDLKDSMEAYIFSQRSPMNICDIVNASFVTNSVKLREKCYRYLVKQMKRSVFIKDLDRLDKDFAMELLKASFSRA